MPAYRTEKSAGAFAGPRQSRPEVPQDPDTPLLSNEEDEKELKPTLKKAVRGSKTEWWKELKPWVEDPEFHFPVDTICMYKSDAKIVYTLTEREIMTLPHESIRGSSKKFFSRDDARELALRKYAMGLGKGGVAAELDDPDSPRLFKKVNEFTKGSWKDNFQEVDGYMYELYRRIGREGY